MDGPWGRGGRHDVLFGLGLLGVFVVLVVAIFGSLIKCLLECWGLWSLLLKSLTCSSKNPY